MASAASASAAAQAPPIVELPPLGLFVDGRGGGPGARGGGLGPTTLMQPPSSRQQQQQQQHQPPQPGAGVSAFARQPSAGGDLKNFMEWLGDE